MGHEKGHRIAILQAGAHVQGEPEKVLDKLMEEGNTDIAEYYATRDKLCQVDEKVDRWGYTALNVAEFQQPDHCEGTARCGSGHDEGL